MPCRAAWLGEKAVFLRDARLNEGGGGRKERKCGPGKVGTGGGGRGVGGGGGVVFGWGGGVGGGIYDGSVGSRGKLCRTVGERGRQGSKNVCLVVTLGHFLKKACEKEKNGKKVKGEPVTSEGEWPAAKGKIIGTRRCKEHKAPPSWVAGRD